MKVIGTIILLVGLFLTQGTAGLFECDDTIYKSGKNIHVHYHNNHESWGSCVRLHDNANWYIPKRRGKSCANARVDGCSIPDAVQGLFTVRDMRLMTPSCNEHDLCYSTKGNSKKDCDDDFKKNLNKTKSKFQGGYVTTAIYEAVNKFGDKSYKDGQAWGKGKKCYK